MEFRDLGDRYILRLDPGEEIIDSLKRFCSENKIESGRVMGIGAIRQTRIGYINLESKDYIFREFIGDYELTSLMGNISIVDGDVFIHLHITATNTDFNMIGGHLDFAIVSATAEIFIDVYNERFARIFDPDTGLRKLDLKKD